jgi:transposase-like protein
MACHIPESVLREALAGGASYAAIARTHGEDPAAVRSRAIGLGLSRSRTQGRLPPEPILRIALGMDNVSQARLARAWGVHPDSVSRAARKLRSAGGQP